MLIVVASKNLLNEHIFHLLNRQRQFVHPDAARICDGRHHLAHSPSHASNAQIPHGLTVPRQLPEDVSGRGIGVRQTEHGLDRLLAARGARQMKQSGQSAAEHALHCGETSHRRPVECTLRLQIAVHLQIQCMLATASDVATFLNHVQLTA